MKRILKPVIVLTVIAITCAGILTAINHFWHVSDDDRFAAAVSSIIKADSFTVIYNYDDPSDQHKGTDEYSKIVNFNDTYGSTNNHVEKVRLAVGGQHDGSYLIQSTGKGYKNAFVQMLTGIDKEGAILGSMLMDFDSINNQTGMINWKKLSNAVKGKTGSVGTGSDLHSQMATSGATRTLNGSAEAINLALDFYRLVILDSAEQPEIETNQARIAKLKQLLPAETEFTKHPIRQAEVNIAGGKASLVSVYTAEDKVILEVKGSYLDFGNWTLLVLVNSDGTAGALVSLSGGGSPDYDEHGNYVDASSLASFEVLNQQFAGKNASQIDPNSDEIINAVTHATETTRGLRITVYHALSVADYARTALTQYQGGEQ